MPNKHWFDFEISTKKPLVLDFCDVTILLGANGPGKSNIINLLVRFCPLSGSERYNPYVWLSDRGRPKVNYRMGWTPLYKGNWN